MKYETYLKSERRNGERTATEDTEVSAEYVEAFTSKETRTFFEELGGTEEMRRYPDGRIYVKATSPEGTEIREVLFTPVRKS